MLSVKAVFDREKISKDSDYTGHLMVSLETEDKDFDRTPVCVALVLDVSGSMGGFVKNTRQSKLEAVKDVASRLVRNLTAKDRIAIVAYSDHVETVLPLCEAGEKEKVLSAIASLRTLGSTNMSGGIVEGLRQIDEKFSGVHRVMVLTDGLANVGVQGRELVDFVKNRDSKATLSTFGFGNDCDQELLADMAKVGGGNYYFIEDSSDCRGVFARELGGIASCIAQGIEILVSPNRGNEVVEVLNDYDVEDAKEGRALIKADDIYVGERKHVVIKMKVGKPETAPKDRPFSVAHVRVTYALVGKGAVSEERELNPKVSFVKAEEADEKPILAVAEQVGILEAAKAHLEAVKLANAGNFGAAQGVLRTAGLVLQDLAAAGSALAGEANVLNSVAADNLSATKYSVSYGTKLQSSARGTSRGKASGQSVGGLDNLYVTERQRKMVESFDQDEDKDLDDAIKQAEDKVNIMSGPSVQDVKDAQEMAENVKRVKDAQAAKTPEPKKEYKGFSKKRKNRR